MAIAAKGQDGGGGMDKLELKKMLRIAKRQPMHCCFALGGDGKAMLTMDKLKKGQGLYRELKQEASDSKNHRWGMVEIDPDNRKRCIFTMNKASGGGMARKLIVALKGTGFSKVLIKLEDGTVDEAEEGEDEELELDGDEDEEGQQPEAQADSQSPTPQAQTTEQPAETSQQASPDVMASDQQTGMGDQPAQPDGQPAAQQDGQPDAAALTKQLTELVKQMIKVIAADPTKKTALAELATDAQASLKRGDLQQAAAGIDILRQAMTPDSAPSSDGAGAQPSATPAQPAASDGSAQPAVDASAQPAAEDDDSLDPSATAQAPAITKARTAWVATRQRVEGDLGKLHNAFGTAFKGHDQEEQIAKAFRERVETVLNTLDHELAEVLESVNRARTRRERAEMVQRAHAILAAHRKHVSSDPTIQALDSNPFITLSIGTTMGATIDALSRAVR